MSSTKLPQVPAKRLIRALERAGFIKRRHTGSHQIMRHETDRSRWAVIPEHGGKPIRPGTLSAILETTGLSADELKELL